MKKFFLTMLGVALMAAPASAQIAAAKVDVAKLRAAVAKSDADIANPKNAAKAATWLKRGETLIDVDAQPVNGIYASMPENMLKISFGDAPATQETVGGTAYSVYTYDNFKAYLNGGVVEFFIQTTVVDPAALDKAMEALDKAYTMDAKTAKKVGENMGAIKIKSFENGGSFYQVQEYKNAAENFRRAYRASAHPSVGAPDTLALYYAGMSAAYGQDFESSLKDLDQVLAMGYDAGGETYRLKFIDLYNLERREESLDVLKAGLAKYPDNENLVELIMGYYAENEGDPTTLIPMVQEAISKSPDNSRLYMGLARIYNKLDQHDNAIEAIKKSVALAPDDYLTSYLEGLFIITKGDAMSVDLSKQNFTSNTQYQAAAAEVMAVFRQSVAPLEKAHELNPEEIGIVELLKNVTTRLREEEGMQEKFKKYTDLFNSMNQ